MAQYALSLNLKKGKYLFSGYDREHGLNTEINGQKQVDSFHNGRQGQI